MVRVIFLLSFLIFVSGATTAQTPGFRFGPRVGMGSSVFTGLPGMRSGLAVQVGLVASKQVNRWFAVQFCPWTGMISSDRVGSLHDGVNAMGRARIYTFSDRYHVLSVGFPLLAKFSAGVGKIHLNAFAGPGIAFNMGGMHTKRYDDGSYNQKDGYSDHPMDGLARSMNYGVLGIGADWETKKNSILALDLQLNQVVSPVGQLEGENYYGRAITLGIAWIH